MKRNENFGMHENSSNTIKFNLEDNSKQMHMCRNEKKNNSNKYKNVSWLIEVDIPAVLWQVGCRLLQSINQSINQSTNQSTVVRKYVIEKWSILGMFFVRTEPTVKVQLLWWFVTNYS